MHLAINFDNKNPLANVARRVIVFIDRGGPKTYKELLAEFWDDARTHEMKEIIDHLILMKKICVCPKDSNGIIRYDIPRGLSGEIAEAMEGQPK